MSDERPDRPPVAPVLEALSVPRNAKIGLAVGVGVAAAAYVVRVFELLGAYGGPREHPLLGPEGWFLFLAFVLAVSTAMLVTVALSVLAAARFARAGEK